jgi:prepilin-type N-terminal cleavage/methylation domain-containing protein
MEYRHPRPAPGHPRGYSLVEILVVLALFGVVAAIAVPIAKPAVGGYKLAGSARNLAYEVSLAKMRAAANFTRARLFVNLGDRTYRLEGWNKTTSMWTIEGGIEGLPDGVGFGYGGITTPPPDTQGTIGLASTCLDETGTVIASTACVVFNSRGTPIDSTGAPTGASALYITDGTAVYGATVAATGMTQLWWTPMRALNWQKQ